MVCVKYYHHIYWTLIYIFYPQAYVELLKEIIFDENFTVVKFDKKIDFPFVQKTKAEEVLYKALETVASENNVKAQKLLVNFNELINSTSVKTFWNGVYIRDEINKTQCIKNILKEKGVSINELSAYLAKS